jgi:nucleoid DNA-binding protein
MKAFAKILAIKLLDRVADRRARLTDDTVAEALEEFSDAITETLAELKERRILDAPALDCRE